MHAGNQDKAELRAAMIGRRRSLSRSRIRHASIAAGHLLHQTTRFAAARRIGAYVAVNGELDPAPLLDTAIEGGKQPCLPVLDVQSALRFAPFDEHTPMEPNRYGIPEPVCEPDALLGVNDLDLLVIPLVVFDRHGHRLGMGAGYYDRALADSPRGRPVRVGFAYEFQRVESIDPEPWDVPMDMIVTDQRIYTPGDNG